MRNSLLAEFQDLQALSDPQRRGLDFEDLIVRLFRAAHFNVQKGAKAALPRQTDLMATSGGAAYLIEVKWKSHPADVSDVDSLYERLNRIPPAVDGVLISMEGFTDSALEVISRERRRGVVIPLDGTQIARLIADPSALRRVLQSSHEQLVVEGTIRTADPDASCDLPPLAELPLIHATVVVLAADGSRSNVLASGGDLIGTTFTRDLSDIDWVPGAGYGVSWDLLISAHDQDDFIKVLVELSEIGWASPGGQWSICQSGRNWHGFGGTTLAAALHGWKDRYADLDSPHHTEQVFYVDVHPEGFYTLSADVAATEERRVWHVSLSLQLHGVPLEQSPFLHLAEKMAPGAFPYFRPRKTDSVSMLGLPRDLDLKLETVATLIEQEDDDPHDVGEWVVGVVARNPFYADTDLAAWKPVETREIGLRDSELIICDLGSWHPASKPQAYRLAGLNWARTTDAVVLQARAVWDEPSSGELISPRAAT